MFQVSETSIDTQALSQGMVNHSGGAFVSFEGRVRKSNDGKAVARLEYELFPEFCIEEGLRIIDEAKALFPLLEVKAVHRYGLLELGEVAVWVGVVTGHRGAGFQACRFIIDSIKARCPIWKKESYVDGPSDWVGCPSCETKSVSAPQIFSRQTRLLGSDSHEKLKRANVLIVGTGGLGCPLALNLAASGVGNLRLIDSDLLEASNLQRQTLYGYQDIGSPKVLLAKRRLEELHPYVSVEAIHDRLTIKNFDRYLSGIDLVVDASDNFATKYLINDTCVRLEKAFIGASIYQNQGHILAYEPGASACLRCDRPMQSPEGCTETCADAGVLGASTSALGSLEALEAIKILLGQKPKSLSEQIYLDFDTFENFSIPRLRNPDCPFGLDHKTARDFVYEEESLFPSTEFEVDWHDTHGKGSFVWIDIREASEREQSLSHAIHLPLSQWRSEDLLAYEGKTAILYCQSGIRSQKLVAALLREGLPLEVKSLRGGFAGTLNRRC